MTQSRAVNGARRRALPEGSSGAPQFGAGWALVCVAIHCVSIFGTAPMHHRS